MLPVFGLLKYERYPGPTFSGHARPARRRSLLASRFFSSEVVRVMSPV